MMKTISRISVLALFAVVLTSGIFRGVALATAPTVLAPDYGAYRFYKDITPSAILVPTAVEITMPELGANLNGVAVYDITANSPEPHYLRERTVKNLIPLRAIVLGASNFSMTDGDTRTYAEFSIDPENHLNHAEITIVAERAIVSSELIFALDTNVASPSKIGISVDVPGQDVSRVVVAPRAHESNTIRFPKTTATVWRVSFEYVQPLRVAEIAFAQENATVSREAVVRWLARPGHSYRVYYDADRYVSRTVMEMPQLMGDEGVARLANVATVNNPSYYPADGDRDGMQDTLDNCVNHSNPDQEDRDGNGRGDACDDFDRDGVVNAIDNCRDEPNRGQRDEDGDGIGDVCDGEESRFTERNAWIPWAGMGIAALVLVSLFVLAVRHGGLKPRVDENNQEPKNEEQNDA